MCFLRPGFTVQILWFFIQWSEYSTICNDAFKTMPLVHESHNVKSITRRNHVKVVHYSNLTVVLVCRRPVRRTWSVCLKTLTCAPFTPSVSPLCRKTSSSHAESEVNELKPTHSISPITVSNSNYGLEVCFHCQEAVLWSIVYFRLLKFLGFYIWK